MQINHFSETQNMKSQIILSKYALSTRMKFRPTMQTVNSLKSYRTIFFEKKRKTENIHILGPYKITGDFKMSQSKETFLVHI